MRCGVAQEQATAAAVWESKPLETNCELSASPLRAVDRKSDYVGDVFRAGDDHQQSIDA